jgi:predicted metalloprotease with PDZ domain
MKMTPVRLCALFLQVIPMMIDAQPRIHYTLSMPRPSGHIFEVTLLFGGLPAGRNVLDVQLPVWRPGRYMVLDFAGGVTPYRIRESGDMTPGQKVILDNWLPAGGS